jgi:copper resistance protein D
VGAWFHTLPEWLELLFLVASIGTVVCRLWIIPDRAAASEIVPPSLYPTLGRFLLLSLIATISGGAGDIMARSTEMTGLPSSQILPVLPTVLFRTHLGRAWLIRIASLCLALVLAACGRRLGSRLTLRLSLALLLVAAFTLSASGHAADAGDFRLPELVDFLHLVAVSVWGGGLVVLAAVILPVLVRSGGTERRTVTEVAVRFSRMAGLAVGIVVVTALYNSWNLVGSYQALTQAPYGLILIMKSYLFVLLLWLGAWNRYLTVPLLRRDAGLEGRDGLIGRLFRWIDGLLPVRSSGDACFRLMRIVTIESVLVLLILFCTSLLRHQIPASHYLHLQQGNAPSLEDHRHHH